jgi:hypothetical protein
MVQIKRGRVMTEAKHTPGPWEWIKSDEYGYSALVNADLNREVIVTGGFNDGDAPITWMGEEMSNADARLIAAAPELLEALEALNATIDAFWNDPSQSKRRPSERHMKAITLAQVESYKAVVKARGEAQ